MIDGGNTKGTTDEVAAARAHWAGQGRLEFYESLLHWRTYVARAVARHRPSSVLEFGCNVGRNLVEVCNLLPDASVVGIDINAEAVEYGRQAYGVELIVGGEEILTRYKDGAFDVAFTVSVLDHVPHADVVLAELARVSSRALILLEPFTGQSRRLDRRNQADVAEVTTTVPFTYAWDYVDLCQRVAPSWGWTWRPYPLSGENAGPYYWLIEGTRDRAPGR